LASSSVFILFTCSLDASSSPYPFLPRRSPSSCHYCDIHTSTEFKILVLSQGSEPFKEKHKIWFKKVKQWNNNLIIISSEDNRVFTFILSLLCK
jgi:hypothetical protein